MRSYDSGQRLGALDFPLVNLETLGLCMCRSTFDGWALRVVLLTSQSTRHTSARFDTQQQTKENVDSSRCNGLFNRFHFLVQILVNCRALEALSLEIGEPIQGLLEKHSSAHCTSTSVCSGCFTLLMHTPYTPLQCSKYPGKITYSKYRVNRGCKTLIRFQMNLMLRSSDAK